MKLFIDIVMKRIYLFNIVAWNYRKKIGFPVCKKENFAGLQAHRKRGKSARASPTPHHTLNEEQSARFTAQHLCALVSLCTSAPSPQKNRRRDVCDSPLLIVYKNKNRLKICFRWPNFPGSCFMTFYFSFRCHYKSGFIYWGFWTKQI